MSWLGKFRRLKRDVARSGPTEWIVGTFFVCSMLFVVWVFIQVGTMEESSYQAPTENDYTRTRVSDKEFNYSYNRFRDSGMTEEEAGAAARATSNYIDKQRVQRAAEANRQR